MGLFLVFLPLWMFVSSYSAIVLLIAVAALSIITVLSTYADAKAADAINQPMDSLVYGGGGEQGVAGRGGSGEGMGGAGCRGERMGEDGSGEGMGGDETGTEV